MDYFKRIVVSMLYRLFATSIVVAFSGTAMYSYAQTGKGSIRGIVTDAQTNEPVAFATIFLTETNTGTQTDSSGNFVVGPLEAKSYTLQISFVGYETQVRKRVVVTAEETTFLEIKLTASTDLLEAVTVRAAPFKLGLDLPPIIHNLGTAEIQRNPGSDNDVSKVIRSLPGVTTTSSFRNDLIIRGGAPNENRFFLDEIEIPVINHLSTQGATGGAFSIINANQLREVDYMSSNFQANRGNALSSVFDFYLRDGNTDSLAFTAWLGGTEAGLSIETPIGEKVSMLLSARRSYRQYILQMINFAFLPVYNDATAKVKIQLNKKSTLTLLGIGAIDQFTLNENVGNNEIQRFLLDNLPVSDQSNYTAGAVYKYYGKQSSFTVVGSRSVLNNGAEKYMQNDASSPDNLILDYTSKEFSNRARLEYAWTKNSFKISLGTGIEDQSGEYDVFNRIYNQYGPVEVDYYSSIRFQQYSVFGQVSKSWWNDRVTLNIGGRMDGNTYNNSMQDMREQLSGRINLTAGITRNVSLMLGAANYYQLPPMMTLSYRNSGTLDNQDVAQYIQSKHYTAGIRWESPFASRLSIEGFLKTYPQYMVSLRDSISLAHIPVDFGVFGNFPVDFSSDGRAYGIETFYQQRMYKGFYGMLAYTLSWSEYKDRNGVYVPSTWDARHIVSFTLGKRFNSKWEMGVNWRMQSPLPFTPFDAELSSYRPVWDVNNQGIRDYTMLNTARGKSTNILNMRIDRIYKFNKWTLNVFLDLENILADTDSQQALILDRQKDANGNLIDDGIILNPEAPYEQQQYKLKDIANAQGAFIPTFGFIVKF
jgi:hypothetical protein